MAIPVINLEIGRPTVDFAIKHMNAELRRAKASRAPMIKLIHGWGSTGSGGAIKAQIARELQKKKQSGMVKGFLRGEDFSPFSPEGRTFLSNHSFAAKDPDYGRNNAGITLVWF